MLKIYEVSSFVSINGGKWRETCVLDYIVTDKMLKNTIIMHDLSFAEAWKYLLDNHLMGIFTNYNLTMRTPIIEVDYRGSFEPCGYKYFNTISYKREFKEKIPTLDWVIRNLSVDDCIRFLKERGMTVCPKEIKDETLD